MAIIYFQRYGAKNILNQLLKSEILVMRSTKHLVSRRKQKNSNIISRYFQLHQDPDTVLKSLGLVLKHQSKLRNLLKNYRGKRKLCKNQREAKKSKCWVVSDSISWCSLTGRLSQTFSAKWFHIKFQQISNTVFHKPSAMLKLPRCWLRKILQKRDCWKPYLDYEKMFVSMKVTDAELIPDFLKFLVPKTDVLLDQGVHNFQLKFQGSEIFTAADAHHKCFLNFSLHSKFS